jgi:hypothetical protein
MPNHKLLTVILSNNNKIEWMPISKVDVDKLSHSPKGAIELHNSTALQHSQSGDHR